MGWRDWFDRRLPLFGLVAGLALCGFAALPDPARLGPWHGQGWSTGFAHPFTAPDPVAAMLALGLWAALNGGRAIWVLPASFAGAVGSGAALALAGVVLPGAEDGVALSLAVLGVLLAVTARARLVIGAALAAAIGLALGYAQATAMPATVSPLSYDTGLLSATLLPLLSGLGLGLAGENRIGAGLLPIAAAAIAGLGISLMLAI